MKINKIRTLWIMFLSAAVTVYFPLKAIAKKYLGTINRAWVDKMMFSWASETLRLVQAKYKVYNPYNVYPEKNRATIVMCNHSSLYDIPLSMMVFPEYSLRMLAKKELSKIPIMGTAMKITEFPFIDRKNKHQAIKDLSQVRELLASGIVMWIAPEGTRSKDGKLAAFKKGAFITAIQAGAMIIPLGIRGAFEILPARTFNFNIGCTAEMHVGKPIDASQYTLSTKEELIARTHQTIRELIEN